MIICFSPSAHVRALAIRPNQMGACSAASPAGVSLISDLWPPPRRSIQPYSASRLRAPAVAAIGSLDTIFQSPALRYCMTCRWLARTRRSAFWLIMSASPSARARPGGGWLRSGLACRPAWKPICRPLRAFPQTVGWRSPGLGRLPVCHGLFLVLPDLTSP